MHNLYTFSKSVSISSCRTLRSFMMLHVQILPYLMLYMPLLCHSGKSRPLTRCINPSVRQDYDADPQTTATKKGMY